MRRAGLPERTVVGFAALAAGLALLAGAACAPTRAAPPPVPEMVGPQEPPTLADADTRFRLASISKVVTAILALQLVDAGEIGLDEPIGDRLAAALAVEPIDPAVGSITLEHLLSHTSGLGPATTAFFGERGLTCRQIAAEALAGRINQPGGAVRYSNTNSCLAGILVEEVTGLDYVDAAARRLLGPLGVTDMRLAGTYDVGPGEAAHFSRPGRNYMEALGPAGGWIASARDVVVILDSINPRTPGWRPLGDDLLDRMATPPLDRPAGSLGLGTIRYPDGSVGHTGTLESTHAMAVTRPDGVTWAVLVNGEYPSRSVQLRSIVDRAFAAGFPAG